MTRAIVALTLAAAMSAAGCIRPNARGPGEDLAASPAVMRGIDAVGGIGPWRGVSYVTAVAVVTTYNEQMQPYTDRQQLLIDLRAGDIQASSLTPRGRWDGSATVAGGCAVNSQFDMSPAQRARICWSLALIAHRVRGALNFFYGPERPGPGQPARVEGIDLVRVGVLNPIDAVACYYDAADGRLRFVTAGSDEPGGAGTVTIYSYQELPGGMAFPQRIRVVGLGQFVLVGDRPVLDAEFSDIVLHR